jgi:hypothetical protein
MPLYGGIDRDIIPPFYYMDAYRYIATATTTNVFVGPGTLKKIVIGETAAGAITIYDETAGGTTTIVAILKASIVEGEYEFNVAVGKGLQIVTGAASKITVVYNRG